MSGSFEHVSFELIKLNLRRSVFVQNHEHARPAPGEVIAMGLSLKNGGEFLPDGMSADFLQSFRTHGGPQLPFMLEAEFTATFSMSRPVPESDQENYIHRIFPQVIFPYTREYVAETTRRGGFPPLLINMNLFPDGRGRSAGTAEASRGGSKLLH
ncbi:MAG: protein-export chaperone SecB [Deltaproteobacteria bacterium]|jgi:hypothetical protein|nr:protein-export chaperone SecB [Deltaproteobacteria bacterium]